jgi:acetyl-CoA C-acetyltransferase
MTLDPDRTPVILGVGQAVERDDPVTARDLMERAAWRALDDAQGVGPFIQQVTVVNVIGERFPRPATALARRLALADDVACQTTVVGGNTPQWLVTRTAEAIAAGELECALIAGAEAQASSSRGELPPDPDADLLAEPPEEALGYDALGFGEAERAIRLYLPIHVYPMFESAMAAAAGRSFEQQRRFVSTFMARHTSIAAKNRYAWFPAEATADELASPGAGNRLTAEPYTKRLNAIMKVDQGAVLIVCSLRIAQELGLEDKAIYVWSGADATEVWWPCQRPDLARSAGIRVAGGAALNAAGIGIDDVDHLDLYSCFPSAVEAGADAVAVALDDPRGLTVTGGLAYFGGPGNNYTAHAIATTVELLREGGGRGLCSGLGWFTTKHSIGIYGAEPPPGGFHRGDTTAAQAEIEASALPVTLDASGRARVVASTVIYDREGEVANVPVFADLADGTRVAATAHTDELAGLAGVSLVGRDIDLVGTDPLVYKVVS